MLGDFFKREKDTNLTAFNLLKSDVTGQYRFLVQIILTNDPYSFCLLEYFLSFRTTQLLHRI